MTAFKPSQLIVGAFVVAAALAVPSVASAQINGVPTPFHNLPILSPCQVDALGNPIVYIAFGTDTFTTNTKVTGSGTLHIDVTEVLSGAAGLPTVSPDIDPTPVYSYSQSDSVTTNMPIPVDPLNPADITMTSKIVVKALKGIALPTFTIKATSTFKVNNNGQVTKDGTIVTAEKCIQ